MGPKQGDGARAWQRRTCWTQASVDRNRPKTPLTTITLARRSAYRGTDMDSALGRRSGIHSSASDVRSRTSPEGRRVPRTCTFGACPRASQRGGRAARRHAHRDAARAASASAATTGYRLYMRRRVQLAASIASRSRPGRGRHAYERAASGLSASDQCPMPDTSLVRGRGGGARGGGSRTPPDTGSRYAPACRPRS
jgi:hypothetical protein